MRSKCNIPSEMWWIRNLKQHKLQVPQYFKIQLVFQYIFHKGAPEKSHVAEEGSERTFRRSILLFLYRIQDIPAVFRLVFSSSVKSRVSPDNSALSVTSHYCLDSHVPWMTSGLQTLSLLLRWWAPLSQMAAAGDRNSGAANFCCAAGLKQAALRLCACVAGTRRGGKVAWCLRDHDNVLGGHFKHEGGVRRGLHTFSSLGHSI